MSGTYRSRALPWTNALAAAGLLVGANASVSAAPTGFVQQRWTGAWGSDGPIFTGDLNGDGKTDVFMWRDSDKSWTVNLSTGSGFTMRRWTGAWGSDGPVNVGDLNGDGKSDVFMWRDSDKSWTVNLSTGSGFTMRRWTGAWGSDGPIFTGDLNGDKKTDVFMWRDSDKSWTINLSTGSGFTMKRWTGAWGSDGPIQVGDLNGDKKTDVFMWRDSDKSWTVNLSTGSGFTMKRWTGAWGSDGPIRTTDLNGDKKTDVFMWRDSDKSWTVNLSTGSGFVMQRWVGACGSDGPVVGGDFDGDGRQDITVWRNDFKQWITNLSAGNGFSFAAWNGAWGSDGPINAGDLNGDGRTDIFMWRDSDRSWTVNLSRPAKGMVRPTVPLCGVPQWVGMGPYSVDGINGSGGAYLPVAGRIDDLQISPDHDGQGTAAMYVTAMSGGSFLGIFGGSSGIWRSTNFTSPNPSWVPLTDHINDGNITDADRTAIMDIPSLAVSPTRPRLLFAATNLAEPALLRSTDGGNNWRLVARGQLGDSPINRVAIDPQGTIYVATGIGLYISTDGGNQFVESSGRLAGLSFTDVAWHSFARDRRDFVIFLAAIDLANRDQNSRSGIYQLVRLPNGMDWQLTTGGSVQSIAGQAIPVSRIEKIKLSTSDGVRATASMTTSDNNPGLINIFAANRDANGISWLAQWTSQDLYYTQQGYVMGVASGPDARVYGGGIGFGQSDGSGGVAALQDTSAGFVSGKTIHVDEHVVLYSPMDQKIYVGTDGGLYRFRPKPTEPGATWEHVNSPSLHTMLSETVAFSPADPLVLLAGHQDNGISSNAGGAWKWAGGNEGEKVYYDPNDDEGSTAYAFDASNLDFLRSTDGGKSFSKLTYPVTSSFEMVFHPKDKGRFMVSSPTAGSNFTVRETSDGWADLAKVRDLQPPIAGSGAPTALAYSAEYRYVAAGGRLYRGTADGQGVVSWSSTPLVQGAKIVSIAVDAANPDAIYFATTSGVFLKQNQRDGLPWTVGPGGNLINLTGNGTFRLVTPIRKFVLTARLGGGTPRLYAATARGVFKGRQLGGETRWGRLGTGLPDAYVSDIDVNENTHFVYVSTFGRGVFYLADYERE